jgi:hypothetical protein
LNQDGSNSLLNSMVVKGVSKLKCEFASAVNIPQEKRRIINREYLQNLELGKIDENVIERKKKAPQVKIAQNPGLH